MEIFLKCKNGHSYKRQVKQLFRVIKGVKKNMNCPDCPKLKPVHQNKRKIEINGKIYRSITQCCKELKICRSRLYNKMLIKKIDIKDVGNIQNEIQTILKK